MANREQRRSAQNMTPDERRAAERTRENLRRFVREDEFAHIHETVTGRCRGGARNGRTARDLVLTLTERLAPLELDVYLSPIHPRECPMIDAGWVSVGGRVR